MPVNNIQYSIRALLALFVSILFLNPFTNHATAESKTVSELLAEADKFMAEMDAKADQPQGAVVPIKISDSQSDAEILKVNCDFFGFEFEIESQQDETIQLNQVPGWTYYSFSAQTDSDGSELLVWKSDLNEGTIDLFNGVLEFTANLLNDGNHIGTKKTCSVVPKSNEANSAFIKRKNNFLKEKSGNGLVNISTDVVANVNNNDPSSHFVCKDWVVDGSEQLTSAFVGHRDGNILHIRDSYGHPMELEYLARFDDSTSFFKAEYEEGVFTIFALRSETEHRFQILEMSPYPASSEGVITHCETRTPKENSNLFFCIALINSVHNFDTGGFPTGRAATPFPAASLGRDRETAKEANLPIDVYQKISDKFYTSSYLQGRGDVGSDPHVVTDADIQMLEQISANDAMFVQLLVVECGSIFDEQKISSYFSGYKAEILEDLACIKSVSVGCPNCVVGINTVSRVGGVSMAPTLEPSECVILEKIKQDGIGYGDLVTFFEDEALFIQRIMALPGDSIEIGNNEVYVNGTQLFTRKVGTHKEVNSVGTSIFDLVEELSVTGLKYSTFRMSENKGSSVSNYPLQVVPDGHVFVMGDHRDRVRDSRYIGTIPINKLIHKKVGKYKIE